MEPGFEANISTSAAATKILKTFSSFESSGYQSRLVGGPARDHEAELGNPCIPREPAQRRQVQVGVGYAQDIAAELVKLPILRARVKRRQVLVAGGSAKNIEAGLANHSPRWATVLVGPSRWE